MPLEQPERPLREWQRSALETYVKEDPKDFLVAATPGAGKTAFALTLARHLISKRIIDRVVVVSPTDHLRKQWASEAGAFGISLNPKFDSQHPLPIKFNGYVTTYAQVASNPIAHRRRCETRRSLVILDEIHHAGDGLTWGEAVREAFAPAARRLALTGTPFRTKSDERIPFVTYEQVTEDTLQVVPNVLYGYREALADSVVRPVMFAAYAGRARWVDSAGEVLSASLGEEDSPEYERAAWATALNPKGRWVKHVFAAADARLSDIRSNGTPDAGGLILANDQESARAYAKVLQQVTGENPTVVLSDDPTSSKRIQQFSRSTNRWLVAVRMVSEGVDVPRLSVLVWATRYRTPLFFAQAVGRVIRARNQTESATVFIPSVKPLLTLAAELESERNNIIKEKTPPERESFTAHSGGSDGVKTSTFTALEADAQFAHVLASGRAVTAPVDLSADDTDYLGIPGLLTAEETAILLAKRDEQLRTGKHSPAGQTLATHDQTDEEIRQEVNRLTKRYAMRAGLTPAQAHIAVRQAVPGPATPDASTEVLTARRDWLLFHTER